MNLEINDFLASVVGDKFSNSVSGVIAVLGMIANYLWGGWSAAMGTLVLFMAIDYITGIMCGKHRKELSSEQAGKGIFKKITILLLVAVGHKIDLAVNAEGLIRSLVLFFYMGQEGISIIENAAVLGIPVPDVLKESLIQLQEGNKKEIKE